MDGATLTELDGTPIVRRPRRSIGIGRTVVLAICVMAIAVDLALRLLSVLPLWSGYESAGVLPMILTSMVGGIVAFLVPAALVLRSPDAWQVRRMLLVGALLGAGAELAHSAGAAASGLAVLQFNAGADPTGRSFMPAADVVNQLGSLGGVVGTLLFAFGLARLRERSAPRSSRGVVAVALVGVGILELRGLWPLVSPPAGVQLADWAWTVPAVLAAGILAALYRAWVILTGWSAGEAPRRAWTWAAAATCVGLATLAIVYLLGLLGVIGLAPGLSVTVLTVVGIGGGLLFVAAVADGLGASAASGLGGEPAGPRRAVEPLALMRCPHGAPCPGPVDQQEGDSSLSSGGATPLAPTIPTRCCVVNDPSRLAAFPRSLRAVATPGRRIDEAAARPRRVIEPDR